MKLFYVAILIAVLSVAVVVNTVVAQTTPVPIQCGTILDAELTGDVRMHYYSLNLSPGDKVTIEASPIGASLDTGIWLLDPSGAQLVYLDNPGNKGGSWPGQPDILQDYEVAATGFYSVRIFAGGDPVGAYTLSIGCKLRKDGTVINPGDTLSNINSTTTIPPTTESSFSGFGFAGLPAVDFANAILLPFTPGQESNGQIPASGDAILGFTFSANAGQRLDFNFLRMAGNLPLGIVVLTQDSQVIFQSSLVNSDLLITRFTLPTTGTYTIGVYRIDEMMPSDAPLATAFQLQGTLSP